MPALLSQDERHRLVVSHLSLVHAKVQGARRANPEIPVDELLSAGYRGLLMASQHYDPSSTASFATYAGYRIWGEMRDFIRQVQRHQKLCVDLPEVDILAHNCQTAYSDLIRPEQELWPERVALASQVLAAVERLPETERTVLKAHFFEDRALSDVAADLGVAKCTVTRCLARAITAIREQLNDSFAEWPEATPRTKTRFSPAFKAQMVRQARQDGVSVESLARKTKVPATNIREWLKRASASTSRSATQLAAA